MSSQYVTLKAGRSYFIEALSIQNEWVSPLRVGVRLPNGTVSVPISKEFLRPSRAGMYLLGLSISRILAIRIFGLAISEYSVIRVWLGCG